MRKNNTNHKQWRAITILSILMLTMAVVLAGCSSGSSNIPNNINSTTVEIIPSEKNVADKGIPKNSAPSPEATAANDIIIPISEISETAKFYSTEIDGTKLEVLAVKAPDGSIRTAFNTCQICYDSGQGYYKQEGDVLVCQNCGNRFNMSQVEQKSGGCNPVPIFAENKTVDNENITISGTFLAEAKDIFANWKTEY